jgi:predicted flavoprotein YhiN
MSFLDLHRVGYHKENAGQMFCDNSSADVAQAAYGRMLGVGRQY